MRTRIVCLGNELVCDDGVGIRIGRALQELELPEHVAVVMAADVGLDLIDAVASSDRLVVVDATRTGRPPGTIHVMSEGAVSGLAQTPCCCHAVGLPELLRLAAHLNPERHAPEVVLIGVEAEVLDQFGTALSPVVRQALPEAAARVLAAVGAREETVARGKLKAAALADWEPTALEAYGG